MTLRPDELDKIGVKMKKPEDVTLEGEYEKFKKIDIENWENVRGKLKSASALIESLIFVTNFRSTTVGRLSAASCSLIFL